MRNVATWLVLVASGTAIACASSAASDEVGEEIAAVSTVDPPINANLSAAGFPQLGFVCSGTVVLEVRTKVAGVKAVAKIVGYPDTYEKVTAPLGSNGYASLSLKIPPVASITVEVWAVDAATGEESKHLQLNANVDLTKVGAPAWTGLTFGQHFQIPGPNTTLTTVESFYKRCAGLNPSVGGSGPYGTWFGADLVRVSADGGVSAIDPPPTPLSPGPLGSCEQRPFSTRLVAKKSQWCGALRIRNTESCPIGPSDDVIVPYSYGPDATPPASCCPATEPEITSPLGGSIFAPNGTTITGKAAPNAVVTVYKKTYPFNSGTPEVGCTAVADATGAFSCVIPGCGSAIRVKAGCAFAELENPDTKSWIVIEPSCNPL